MWVEASPIRACARNLRTAVVDERAEVIPMAVSALVHASILPHPASAAIVRVVDVYVARHRLTAAEREILVAVTAEGIPPRKLALAFLRSEETTKTHVRNLLAKAKFGSFAELALVILREALHAVVVEAAARPTEAAREEKTNVGEGSSECPSRAVAVVRRRHLKTVAFGDVVHSAPQKRSRFA